MSILALESISRNFGGLWAVKDVSLHVERGERRAIIGPNGAGKSTLFNLIAGNLAPTSGRVLFDGTEITKLTPERRAHAGIARTYQVSNVFKKLTVLENVVLALQAFDKKRFSLFSPLGSQRVLLNKAREMLERWDLVHCINESAEELSHGEQRKLEVVLTLAGSPQLILLDEPAAGLSPAEVTNFLHIIDELPTDVTVVIIDHDLEVVFSIAEKITVMNRGEILTEGNAAAIRDDSRVSAIYLGKSQADA